MMWGEEEVPFVMQDNSTKALPPYVASPGLLGTFDGSQPWQWAIVVACKTVAIFVSIGGGYPGGIVYPLFFLGALVGKLFCVSVGIAEPYQSLWILCMMVGLQGSVTRTPWGTVMLVLGLHGWQQTSEDKFAYISHALICYVLIIASLTIFPAILFTSMVVSLTVSYPFPLYKQQHGRADLRPSRGSKPKYREFEKAINERTALVSPRKEPGAVVSS